MSLILSCDDACASDVRLAELARKYDVKCTFYWPVEHRSLAYDNGYEPLTYIDQLSIAADFEVGSHTLTHRHLTKLDIDTVCNEIVESQVLLQAMFSQPIQKFCFPRGYSNPEISKYVSEFYESSRFTKGIDDQGYKLVHVHPNSGANNNQRWQSCMTDMTHLWMHSHELDRFGLWEDLESVMKQYA